MFPFSKDKGMGTLWTPFITFSVLKKRIKRVFGVRVGGNLAVLCLGAAMMVIAV